MNDDELTPSEKEAMAALPRERAPSPFLEERVVRALRNRGVLEARKRRFVEVTALRTAGAVAACLVILIGGIALGRWSSSLQIVDAESVPFAANEVSVAASLQRAGTAYVLALESLASLSDPARDQEMRQGCEIALVTLYTAADEMAKIVPREHLARQLLRAIEANGEAGADGTRMISF
jgi:hypothetical protein